MSEFVTSKRRKSYLAHTSCPIEESVTRELLVAFPAVAREGSVYHQGGLVALVHHFSSFLFLQQSLLVARESPAPEGMLLHFTFQGPAHRVISKNPIAIGGCLSLHWQLWSDEGAEPWVVEVLRWGIPDFLPLGSHLIQGSHPFTGV